jgi:DNA-binding NarL/FixJ family response regulator
LSKAGIGHTTLSATFDPSDDRSPMTDPAILPGTDTSPAPSPRLLVVDADDRTRESIVGILGIGHRFEVVGSAAHAGAAIALMKQLRPDVVVIDPRLPELPDGIALIKRIRTIDPRVRILAVGWTPALEHDTLEAGADGFVRKTFKPGDLSGAIDRCMDARPDASGTGIIL